MALLNPCTGPRNDAEKHMQSDHCYLQGPYDSVTEPDTNYEPSEACALSNPRSKFEKRPLPTDIDELNMPVEENEDTEMSQQSKPPKFKFKFRKLSVEEKDETEEQNE